MYVCGIERYITQTNYNTLISDIADGRRTAKDIYIYIIDKQRYDDVFHIITIKVCDTALDDNFHMIMSREQRHKNNNEIERE